MKKRLIALLVIVVMLAAFVFTCVSCSTGIFSKDEERDYYQVIATVTYGDLSKDIYKGQLATYVNSYGSTYQSNYNMTIDQIVEYFYNTLTRSALLTLYAKYYVYEQAKAGVAEYAYIDTTKNINELSDADFVSLQERVYSIDQTNDDFMSSYESILSNLTKSEDEEEEETDEDALDPRTVRTYDEEDTSVFDKDLKCTALAAIYGIQYQNYTYGDITEDFIKNTLHEESVDAFLAKLDVFNVISEKIKAETDTSKKKDMKSALKTLRENMSKSYSSYDWFYEDNLNSCVVNDLKDGLKKSESSTDAQINARYAKLIVDNLANVDEDTYSSAISGSTFMPVNASQSYVGVKSILLKFSDEQSAVLTALKSIYSANEDLVAQLRDDMALGNANATLETYLGADNNKGIKVNISNAFYDADEDKIEDAYTDKDVNYAVVLYVMANSVANITNEIVTKYTDSDAYKALSAQEQQTALAIVTYSAKVEAFTQWMYLVNDDSGMFSNETYTITPDGKDSNYVEEYTVLARKLAQQDIGSYVSNSYAGATDITKTVNYTEGSAAYIVENKTLRIYEEDAQSTTTATEPLKAVVYTAVTEEGNALSFIVNDYGIHVIIVAEKYGESNFVADVINKINDKGEVVAADEDGYAYTLDAIYDRATKIKYDFDYTAVATDAQYQEGTKYYLWDVDGYELANVTAETFDPSKYTYYTRAWNLQKVTCEYQTLKGYLDDEIVNAMYSDKYSTSQLALYLDSDPSGRKATITKVDKVYDGLIKEYNS